MHESTQPLCLHGYALSKAGAKKLLSYLSNPWVAYQTPVDTVLPFLIQHKLIQSYSVEPPLIIQNKASVSDIQSGAGSAWRGVLMDSTLERLMMDEGTPIPSINFLDDPARQFRYVYGALELCGSASLTSCSFHVQAEARERGELRPPREGLGESETASFPGEGTQKEESGQLTTGHHHEH